MQPDASEVIPRRGGAPARGPLARLLGPAAWPAAVALGASLPLLVAMAAGRGLAWKDSVRLFEPMRALIGDAIRGGRLPLWNPFEGLGMPLHAQFLHGVLHPVSLLGALVLPGGGMDPLIVLHVALAALGAYFLAREVGASASASAVSGFAYGLSGYVLGMSAVAQYLMAAGTAPWTVAALRTAGRGQGWVLAAIAVAVQLFAGDPQWAVVAAGLGAALALEAGGARGLARAAAAVLLGSAIAAIQLVPAWSFMQQTTRVVGLTSEERIEWALAPARVLEFALPGLLGGRPGANSAAVFVRFAGPSGHEVPFVPSVFLGTIVLALAALGTSRTRTARVLAGASVLFLWLALGFHSGAEQALRAVPIWGSFRYSEKLVGPLALCLAVLAGLGTDRLPSLPAGRWLRPLIGATALLGVATLILGAWPGAANLLPGSDGSPVDGVVRTRLHVGLLHATLSMAALGAALWLLPRFGTSPWTRLLVPALVFAEAVAALPFAMPLSPWETNGAARVRDVTQGTAVPRLLTADVSLAASSIPPGMDDFDALGAVTSRMGMAAFNVAVGVDQFNAYTGVLPRRLILVSGGFTERFGPSRYRALRRFAVTHVAVGHAVLAGEAEDRAMLIGGGQEVGRDEPWGVAYWAVPHRPFASFANSVVQARSDLEATDLLLEIVARGSEDVVQEGPLPPGLSRGRVIQVQRSPESLLIEAVSEGDGVLVVNDAYWTGWRAAIDGTPVPVYPADVMARAIPWPAGRHVLRMQYDPPEVKVGWAVTAGGLAAALLALGWARRRPRPGHGHRPR